MTKLWTIPSLFLATGLLVVACSPAEPEKTSGADDEESIVSSLPLSDECSSCAVDQIGSTCSEALDACADDADCLDPQACFGTCEPDDVSCFATCAAASALFDALVECVVCDACADACEGEWTCGGGDDPDDDGGDECEDDQDCNDGGDEHPDCEPGDPNCEHPDDGGNEDPECEEGQDNCEHPDDGGNADPECEAGQDCEHPDDGGNQDPDCEDGQDNCGGEQPDDGGEGSACLSCVHQEGAASCGDVVEACLSNDGCNYFVECVHDCGPDAQCAAECGQEGENNELVQQVLDCVLCGPCQESCAVEAFCG